MKRIFCFVFVLTASWTMAFSQTDGRQSGKFSIGVFGAYNLNFHNASFLDIPTVPVFTPRNGTSYEPTAFGNTSNGGAAFGALVMYNFSEELALSLRLGYGGHNALFRTTSTYPVGRTDGTTVDATSEYSINASIGAFSIEPLVSYRIVAGLQAYLGVRVNVVANNSFDQRETLIAPTDGGFDQNRNRSRNIRTGTIPQLQSLWFSGVAGLGYDIPLSEALILSPEAFYSLGLTRIVQGINWNINTLRGGISLRYRL
jgi:hypothetical protein